MLELASFSGQTLAGKYRLEELLGKGGMGAVFRATHTGTDRVVALKLIAPGFMDHAEFVARFQREAQATGRLRHPNIVDLTDFGFADLEEQKLAYLVMEYLEGETLTELLKRNPTPPLPFVVALVQQVCSALQEAHDKGIVHRDLKPDNLWLEPDRLGGLRVKVLDFGLAKIYDPKARSEGLPGLPTDEATTLALAPSGVFTKALETPPTIPGEGQSPLTQVGTRLGTPAYMSPEQCRAVAVDHHSDLYSLGVIAYQMLGGHTPFQGNSLDLINHHIQTEVPDLREQGRPLPPGLAELVMECLAKDPGRRPASAEVLGNAFEAAAEGLPRQVQRGISLMLDRWPEVWPQIWRTFLGPFLLVVATYLPARFFELGLEPSRRVLCFAPVYTLALTWCFVGFGMLKGKLGPLVLWHTLFPLRPLPPEAMFLSREQRRAHLKWVLLNASLLLVLFAFLPFLYLAGTVDIPRKVLLVATLGSQATAWALIGFWTWKSRKLGGSASGLLPSVMYVEDLPPKEAGARIVALKAAMKAHKFDPGRGSTEAGVGILSFVLLLVALLVGLDSLTHGSTPDLPLAIHSYFLWYGILLVPAWALLGTLEAILTALTYLRFRKLARESLRDAFERLASRLEGGGGSPASGGASPSR
jgi:serine/threonine protein kinase